MDGLQNSFLSALYGYYRALYGQKQPYSARIYTGEFYALFSVIYGLNLTGLPNRWERQREARFIY